MTLEVKDGKPEGKQVKMETEAPAEVRNMVINGKLFVPIEFVVWYSGMKEEQIIKQYYKWVNK